MPLTSQLLMSGALMACTACTTQYFTMQDELYTPQALLKEDEKKHFLDDAKMCRAQTLDAYKKKLDIRNITTDFRACLIHKGYVLLS